MIPEAACAALDTTMTTDPVRVEPPHVLRRRARVARHVVAMLGVPPSQVRVTDDPLRAYGTHPGDLVSVYDPDPHGQCYLFIPEPSHGGLFYLLDECPLCNGRAVPVAVIATLHDLGRYLGAAGRLSDLGVHDAIALDVPATFGGDVGHQPGCEAGSDHQDSGRRSR